MTKSPAGPPDRLRPGSPADPSPSARPARALLMALALTLPGGLAAQQAAPAADSHLPGPHALRDL